jgi:hypothetical protein
MRDQLQLNFARDEFLGVAEPGGVRGISVEQRELVKHRAIFRLALEQSSYGIEQEKRKPLSSSR